MRKENAKILLNEISQTLENGWMLKLPWSAAMMEQFHLQKFVSLLKERSVASTDGGAKGGTSSWIGNIARCALEAYHLGFGTEFLITTNSSVLVEAYGDGKDAERHQSKAIFNHKYFDAVDT